MIREIPGIHHVTSIASDPKINNEFFNNVLGFRRIKKTINFDNPAMYHVYYFDPAGAPWMILTYFPFPMRKRGRRGALA